MAKISRTPFNASRMITGGIRSDTTLREKTKGYTYFVKATSTVAINITYTDKGSYYKFIIKEESVEAITIDAPDLVGLMISDDGSNPVQVIEGVGTTLTIPAGAKAGTYVDLICDGSKWYARGMSAGSTFTIS